MSPFKGLKIHTNDKKYNDLLLSFIKANTIPSCSPELVLNGKYRDTHYNNVLCCRGPIVVQLSRWKRSFSHSLVPSHTLASSVV